MEDRIELHDGRWSYLIGVPPDPNDTRPMHVRFPETEAALLADQNRFKQMAAAPAKKPTEPQP